MPDESCCERQTAVSRAPAVMPQAALAPRTSHAPVDGSQLPVLGIQKAILRLGGESIRVVDLAEVTGLILKK